MDNLQKVSLGNDFPTQSGLHLAKKWPNRRKDWIAKHCTNTI